MDETGNCCVGFGVDIIKEFARRWTGDETAVQFIPITTADQPHKLSFNQWDIWVTSLPQSWELEVVMDFSQPYLLNNQLTSIQASSGDPPAFADAPISFGLPNGDTQLRDLLNFTLQGMVSDCTYQQIYQKWFPNTAPYPIEIWPGKPADPFIWNMVKSTSNACAEIQSMPAITTANTITPSVTAFSTAIVHTASVSATELLVASPIMTTTLVPTESLQITSVEQITAAVDLPPQDYPNTGMSMYSYRFLPLVVLLITSLFGGAIYQKQRQQKVRQIVD